MVSPCLEGMPINVLLFKLVEQAENGFKSDLLKLLIESLVLSHLIYCLPVWGFPLTASNINRMKSLQHQVFSFVWAFDSMITFHNITVWNELFELFYSGYLCEMRFSTVHFVQCTTSIFSLNTFHLYHQFSLVTSINMWLELLNSLLSHLDANFLYSMFFHYNIIHWWNAVPIDILTSATFKDDLFLHEFL